MKKTLIIFFILTVSAFSYPRKDTIVIGSNSVKSVDIIESSRSSVNYRGVKAFDSSIETSWISKEIKEKRSEWIAIDFGSKRLMTSIVLYPGKKDNAYTFKYIILQFQYKGKWFDFKKISAIERGTFSDSFLKKIVIPLGGIDASTFRFYVPADAVVKKHAAIAEIEIKVGSAVIGLYDKRLKNLELPIKNAYLPENDYSYPNAPRAYRGGKHSGIDFFYYHEEGSYDPVKVTKKTPVLSSGDGIVIRADINYNPMTVTEWYERSNYFKKNKRTFVKKSFGGIQVWIDHQNGIVTAYNHLSNIDPSIKTGVRVKAGQKIGCVGNSGLIGEAKGNGFGIHLHYEIWVDGDYLGSGMKVKDVKEYIKWIFFPLQ